MRVRGKLLLVTLVCLLAAGSLLAQTTRGSIQGSVVDEGNQPLPGVTITVTSPALMGSKSAVSDANGEFRFSLLPPGTYKAVFSLPGYQRVEQENVVVQLAGTITLDVTLNSAFTEEVLVTSQAPLVDVTSTTVGSNLGQDLIVNLPTGRTFSSLTFLAAGAVTGGQGQNVNIMGATGSENRYVVDELDTTDPAFGTIGTQLSFNFIQEVQVQTGGYEPEYGGALGGVINMITKSGSNEFHGEVFGYYTDDSFSSEAKKPAGRGAANTQYTDYDVGFDLGGKIIEDKLWYFVAYNPNVRENTWVNEVFTRPEYGDMLYQTNTMKPKTTANYYAAKLTWQANENNSVTGSVFGDPTTIDNNYYTSFFVDTPYVPTDQTYAKWDEGGTNYGVTWNSIFNEDMIFEAKVGHMETKQEYTPNLDIPFWYDGTTTGRFTDGVGQRVAFGGPGFQQPKDKRERDQLRAAFTWFIGDAHEVKVGAQWNWVKYDVNYNVAGPNDAFCAPLSAYAYTFDYINSQYLYATPDNEQLLNNLGYYFCDPGNGNAFGGIQQPARVGNRFLMFNNYYYNRNYKNVSSGETDESAIFLQDAWKVTDYFTLNVGVRADAAKAKGNLSNVNANQDLRFTFQDQIQPRVGFIWDFAHNGRSKVFGHYGKFYESIPLDINVRAFGNESYDFYYYYYPEDGSLPTVNNATLGSPNNTGEMWYWFHSGGGTKVDPGIQGQYTEEYVGGVEYEVMNNLAVGFQGIYRRLGRVIEDISADNGATYFITNPGGCIDANPTTGVPLAKEACFPPPSRIYRGLELKVNKRYSNNWQMYASLLWSRNKGNYGGLFRADNGQVDPNITSLYDLPQLLVGAYGLLPNDHKWQFKSYGSYRWDFGLVTGYNFTWLTGAPITQLGADLLYGTNERFVTPRGSYGRTPSTQNLDLHFSYPLKMFGDYDLELVLDVFNAFNQQKALTVDQEWTTLTQRDVTDADGNVIVSVADQKNNPNFGEALSYQAPRNYRLGVKFSW